MRPSCVLRANTSPSRSGWGESPNRRLIPPVRLGPADPWVFPYVEYPVERAYPPEANIVLRPVVEVTVHGSEDESKISALVDSGAENTLLAPWTKRVLGLLPDPTTEIEIGIGGRLRKVQFCDVDLSLHRPDSEEVLGWRAEVGVIVSEWDPPFPAVLGQRGFLDQFTVTMHRGAQALVVEDWHEFDRRFPP